MHVLRRLPCTIFLVLWTGLWSQYSEASEPVDCHINSAVTNVGLAHSHHVRIRSAISGLHTSQAPLLPREVRLMEVGRQLHFEVLRTTNRETVLIWHLACAEHPLASALRLSNFTSAYSLLVETHQTTRAHVTEQSRSKRRIATLVQELYNLRSAIQEEADAATQIQLTGEKDQYKKILGGKSHSLRQLRLLPERVAVPLSNITHEAKSFLDALEKWQMVIQYGTVLSIELVWQFFAPSTAMSVSLYLQAMQDARVQVLTTFASTENQIDQLPDLCSILNVVLPEPWADWSPLVDDDGLRAIQDDALRTSKHKSTTTSGEQDEL